MAVVFTDIIGLTPFIIIAVACLTVFIMYVVLKIPLEIIIELVLSAGIIWMVTIAVMLFVTIVCASVRLQELFENAPVTEADLAALEKQVCMLASASDKYIMNDVGQEGQDNPIVLAKALITARGAAPITECELSQARIEDRVARMENTLKNFTGPQLQKTYDRTVSCKEEFVSGSGSGLGDRLKAIKATVDQQNNALLTPLQKKEADLKAFKLTDCDKKKGANKMKETVGPQPPNN